MSQLASFTPQADPPSREEILLENRRKSLQNQDLIGAALDATDSWTSSWVMRQLTRPTREPDPSFKLSDPKTWELLSGGVSPSLWPDLADATSLDHGLDIRDRLLERQGMAKGLSEQGWKGIPLAMVVGMGDPVVAAATMLTGGLGAAGAATRIGAAVRGGLVASATLAPFDLARAAVDPEYGAGDALFSAITNFGMGGVFGALHGPTRTALNGIAKDIEYTTWKGAMGASHADEFGPVPGEALRGPPVAHNEARLAGTPLEPKDSGITMTPELADLMRESTLTERGKVAWRNEIGDQQKREAMEFLIEGSGLDPVEHADTIKALRELPPDEALSRFIRPEDLDAQLMQRAVGTPVPPRGTGGTVGTGDGRIPSSQSSELPSGPNSEDSGGGKPPPAKKPGDLDLSGTSDAPAPKGGIGLTTWLTSNDKNPLVRWVARALGHDGQMTKAGDPLGDSVTLFQRRHAGAIREDFYRKFNANFADWAQDPANGVTMFNRYAKMVEFDNLAGIERKTPASITQPHPAVKQMAADATEHYGRALDLAKRHQVPGAENLTNDPNYFARLWNHEAVQTGEAKYGSEFHEFLANAIREADKKAGLPSDPDVTARMAKGMTRTIARKRGISDSGLGRMLSGASEDDMRAIFKEVGISEAEGNDILARMKIDEPGGSKFFKPRAMLDEGYGQTMSDGKFLRVSDLVDNGLRRNVESYVRDLTARSGEAEFLRAFNAKAGTKITTTDGVLNHLRENGADLTAIKRLNTLKEAIMGHAHEDPSVARSMLGIMRGLNHMALSGGFFWNHVSQFGGAVFENGWRTFMDNMPELSRIFARAKNGELDSPILRDIFGATGLDDDLASNHILSRFNPYDTEAPMGGKLQQATDLVRRGAQFSNRMSLFKPMMTMIRRMGALSITRNMAREALGDHIPKVERLAQYGMTPDDWGRFQAMIRENRDVIFGGKGDRAVRVNFNDWTDQQIASKFVLAIQNAVERYTLKMDPGETPLWMTKELGKVFSQFQTAHIAMYEKAIRHGVQVKDAKLFANMIGSTMLAAMAYTGRHAVNSIGRADAEEYRDKMLAPAAIAKAAFAKGGYASLIPGAIDTWQRATGGQPYFTATRTTGLDTSFFLGNPTVDLATAAVTGGMTIPGKHIRGYLGLGPEAKTLNQHDMRNYVRLLPFQNVIGIKNMIDAYVTRFPVHGEAQ